LLVVVEHHHVWYAGFREEGLKVFYTLSLVVVVFDAIFFAETQFVIKVLTLLSAPPLPPAMQPHKMDYLIIGGV
jgi:hypothetical protein